jgi:tRNA-specific 2-thiouridylase
VLCNREVKFGVALSYARRLGAELFATGHYARLEHTSSGVELHKGRDLSKDQSYFLHAVERSALAGVLMPLGDLLKEEVRHRARRAGLPVYDKPDSTGLCFIGERPFREFLARFVPEQPGAIETAAGERIGTHRGLPFYTLGQRTGLAIGGRAGTDGRPWYVAAKDAARNVLTVVQGEEHPLLWSRSLTTEAMSWLADPYDSPRRCTVKVRYRQADQSAWLQQGPHGSVRVTFDEPQRAVTPGQCAVLYDGERCLGGGVIAEVVPASARHAAA